MGLKSTHFEAGLGLSGYAIGAWGLVWAQPYVVCLCLQLAACLTAVLLVLINPQKWSLTGSEGRLNIAALAILPSLTLGLRACWDTGMIDWQVPLLWASGGNMLLVFLVMSIEQRINSGALFWLILFGFSAVFGTLSFVNCGFDTSAGRGIPVRVLDKSWADKRARSYDLRLSSWGDREDYNFVSVSQSFYAQIHTGDTVCVRVRDGLLGFEWFEIADAAHCT